MTTRRELLIALGAGAIAVPFASFAQQPQKVYRVGFLFAGTLAQRPQAQAFWQGLRELGYTEGKNIVIEVREAKGRADKLPELAANIVNWKPDVIVAVPTAGAAAAQRSTGLIPIVMVVVTDPLGAGLVKSLARPEANITGVSTNIAELGGKQLQLLKELLPKVSRIGILWNSQNPSNVGVVKLVETAAPSLGVQLQSLSIRGPNDLDGALAAAVRGRSEALFVVADFVAFDHRGAIIAFAADKRLPTMHTWPEEALDGGLVAYGPKLSEQYSRAAYYVDRILKGAKPSDLPVEQPTIYELVINMKAARALGITVPQSILLRADKVIE